MDALSKQKHKYDDRVSKVIDGVLTEIFGDEGALIIYKYLENCCSLRQGEFTGKIDVFAEGLKELLGSGAYVIEKNILEAICSSYGLPRRLEFEKRIEHDFVSQMTMLQVSSFTLMKTVKDKKTKMLNTKT